MDKFSVLMSVYWKETASNLVQSLDSVFEQTVEPNEVVLVKDGPLTGELDAVIAEFSNKYDTLKVVALPQNVGLGCALNEGLKHCSYELVARMDSDDICVADRFERQLNAFKQMPDIDIVGAAIEEFSISFDQIESRRVVPQTHAEIVKYSKHRSPVNHVSVMFKKQAVIDAGAYQHFYLLEDYWLWARMLKNGAKFHNLPDVLVYVRGGIAMSARRGGLKYAMSEVKLQKQFYSMKIIGLGTFCINVIGRFTTRIIPNKLRIIIYSKLLRKK